MRIGFVAECRSLISLKKSLGDVYLDGNDGHWRRVWLYYSFELERLVGRLRPLAPDIAVKT